MSSFAEVKSKKFLRGLEELKKAFNLHEDGPHSLTALEEFAMLFSTPDGVLPLENLLSKARECELSDSKLRCVYWKVYLSCLSTDSTDWHLQLTAKRKQYDALYLKYVESPLAHGSAEDSPAAEVVVTGGDDPLATGTGTLWDGYFQDRSLRERIELDVHRTFSEHTLFRCARVRSTVADLLFIYAKEHPSVEYHQGMNELLAVLLAVNLLYSTRVYPVTALAKTHLFSSPSSIIPKSAEEQKSEEEKSTTKSSSKAKKSEAESKIAALFEDSDDDSGEEEVAEQSAEEIERRHEMAGGKLFDSPTAVGRHALTVRKESVFVTVDSGEYATDMWKLVSDAAFVEHDTYFMFECVMHSMADHFSNLKGSSSRLGLSSASALRKKERSPESSSFAGSDSLSPPKKAAEERTPPIVERCQKVQNVLLRKVDPELALHLEAMELSPQLYGMRWMRLFFQREFHLRDVLSIWDSIFAVYCEDRYNLEKVLKMKQWRAFGSKGGFADDWKHVVLNEAHMDILYERLSFKMVDYMAVSMLMFVRSSLLEGDINVCLCRVMKYPPVEAVTPIVAQAYVVRCAIEADEEQRRARPKAKKVSWKPGESAGDIDTVPMTRARVLSDAGSAAAAALLAGVDSLLGVATSPSVSRSPAKGTTTTTATATTESDKMSFSDRFKLISSTMTKTASQVLGFEEKESQKRNWRRLQIEHALGDKLNGIVHRIEHVVSSQRDAFVPVVKSYVSSSASPSLEIPAAASSASEEFKSEEDASTRALLSSIADDAFATMTISHSPDETTSVSSAISPVSSETKLVNALFVDAVDDPLIGDIGPTDKLSAPIGMKKKAKSAPITGVKVIEEDAVGVLSECVAEMKLIRDAMWGIVDDATVESWLGIGRVKKKSSEVPPPPRKVARYKKAGRRKAKPRREASPGLINSDHDSYGAVITSRSFRS